MPCRQNTYRGRLDDPIACISCIPGRTTNEHTGACAPSAVEAAIGNGPHTLGVPSLVRSAAAAAAAGHLSISANAASPYACSDDAV